jgi:hypothetical protein
MAHVVTITHSIEMANGPYSHTLSPPDDSGDDDSSNNDGGNDGGDNDENWYDDPPEENPESDDEQGAAEPPLPPPPGPPPGPSALPPGPVANPHPKKSDEHCLTDMLDSIAKMLATQPEGSSTSTSTKACLPDPFTGNDPEKLPQFLLQCCLYFCTNSIHFKTDVSKVNFPMIFLTKSALQWFDVAVKLEENDSMHEAWSTSWVEFVKELWNTFRIANLQVKATEALDALHMKLSDQILTYNVEFMCHATHIQWGDECKGNQTLTRSNKQGDRGPLKVLWGILSICKILNKYKHTFGESLENGIRIPKGPVSLTLP